MSERDGLLFVGTIYALYVGDQFIEHFVSVEAANRYAGRNYKSLSFFVRPLTFFDVGEHK